MRYENVCLSAFGYALPPRVVTSAALEDALAPVYEALGMPPGRLELMSGVRERRFWEPGTRVAEVSARSAGRALAAAGLPGERVGALVHASVCRDYLEPATASVVAGELGLDPGATVFDVSNACLGFVNACVLVANMIELDQIEAGLVVATEDGSPLVEATIDDLKRRAAVGELSRKALKPSFASLTIGSGSVACVLTRADLAARPVRLLGGAVRQATEHSGLCRSAPDQAFAGGAARPLMETDAVAVLEHGCALAARTWAALAAELGWSPATPERIFCHQVGESHRRRLLESIGLDPARDFPTLATHGNTGSVAMPLAMALALDEGGFGPGERAALLGIGSGLNCVMLAAEHA